MAQNNMDSSRPAVVSHSRNPYIAAAALLVGVFFASVLIPHLRGQVRPAEAAQPQQTRAVADPVMSARIAELEKQLLQAPGDADQWTELGNLYFDTGAAAKAIAAYNQSLKLRPAAPNVLTDLGIMYRETAQYQKAVKAFEQAIRLNSTHQNAMFNLGVVLYFDLHQQAEGKLIWNKLLRVNPQAMTPDGQSIASLLNTLPE